jgi:radical SAM superfamily enzyme YgiQ (UPF0313 family)
VLQELRLLSRQGYKVAIFMDENLTVSASRIDHLCRLIIQDNLQMRFAFEGFLEHLSDSTLELMRQAGFDLAFVGVESGSDPQRRRYRKPGSAHAVAQGMRRAQKHHFLVHAFLMIGGPGETQADLENTKNFLREAQPHLININAIKVHPGTQLWHELAGPGEPATLKDADSRHISDFPGQSDQATLAKQAREIYQFYLRRLFRWGNVLEFLRLFRYNSLVRVMIWSALKRISVLLQLLKPRYS